MLNRLQEDIAAVFDRDPAVKSTLEVLTCYPGMRAIWIHRLSHRLYAANWPVVARMLSGVGRFLSGVEIHPGATIGRRFFIDHGMGIVIGETAIIGDDVTIYHGVTLGGTTWNKGKRHPTLEDGVVIGAGAKVLGPFTVGQGARIGSNSVVTKAVPPGATVTGIPGRVLVREVDDAREAMQSKHGFDMYGVTEEMPDPVARSIRALLDQTHAMESKIDAMGQQLCKLDPSFCDDKLPQLDSEAFSGMGDKG
ncbi:serine O-acetyltransferase [Litorivicinus lipolyticus]|uniref:serine O-acetyltransferase n=1 Tax=Litorivicinus lipolyticus TaxID=418701 RepID=UPI003B5A5D90